MRHRRWQDLSRRQRAGVLVLGPVELTLAVTAAVDLYLRPQEFVRGPEPLWWLGILVQPRPVASPPAAAYEPVRCSTCTSTPVLKVASGTRATTDVEKSMSQR